ncbi:T-cell ecto-ADP-ribosyltransferase 2-like [Rhynchocyon petersi]
MTSLVDIAVPWFILTSWLTQQVAAQANLDMADDAFDDQYEGCTEEMEERAPQLLEEEIGRNPLLKAEWEKAEQRWKKIKTEIENPNSREFIDFHGTAIVAYTGSIYHTFNKAVREFRQNPQNFQFKAFHYYLTRALQILSTVDRFVFPRRTLCYRVYRACNTTFHYSGRGDVRFGQFASSSTDRHKALEFANRGTMFSITTCLGVKIDEFSYYKEEKEVLIPGYEVYQNISINNRNKNYVEIQLGNPRKGKSNFNCLYSVKNPTVQDNFNHSGERQSMFKVEVVGKS